MDDEVSEGEARRGWKQDPDAVRANILAVASEVFAETGFSGGRIEDIAARTATSKRMIYYYFNDKAGLYRAVLENVYAKMRLEENALDLAEVPPVEALRLLTEFTFDHHRRNPEFIRLVMIENVHGGAYMSQSQRIAAQNSSAIRHLEDIYCRGCDQGLFRRGLSALELHWHVSALCYFNVSNRTTFSRIFGDELFDARGQEMLRRHVGDMILRFVMRDGVSLEEGPGAARGETLAKRRHIDPDILRFLEVWEAKWAALPGDAGPAARRARLEANARAMRLPTPEGLETDEEHWVGSVGGPARVRFFRPGAGAVGQGAQPALIYLHGGGWSQGSPESHWDITARLAAWSGAVVLSVDYALAPEHPYPAAVQQCQAVLRWVRDEATQLGLDPGRIAVGGDSAGGNLAAATALWARDAGCGVAAQLLIYPISDFDMTRASVIENAEGPLLKAAGLAAAQSAYCPDPALRVTDPYVAPLRAPDQAGLPPTFVAVAEYDPLRDSGRAHAAALGAAGVAVETDAGEELIHGYLHALDYCPAAEARLRRMSAWLKRVLGT